MTMLSLRPRYAQMASKGDDQVTKRRTASQCGSNRRRVNRGREWRWPTSRCIIDRPVVKTPAGENMNQWATNSSNQCYLQSSFAADFLYIATLFCAKSSVVILLTTLTPVRMHKILSYATGGFIALWSLSSLFAIAFQCHTPKTWIFIGNKCFDRVLGFCTPQTNRRTNGA